MSASAPEVEDALAAVAAHVRGLRGVFVSDRDGVPILCHSTLRPSQSPGKKSSAQTAPLDGAFALSADQISRLQLGECETMCGLYDEGIVMHVNAYPLVLTLVGDSDSDAEEILALAPRIQAVLAPLQETIARSISE